MNVGLFGSYLRNRDGNSRNLKKLFLDMIFVSFLKHVTPSCNHYLPEISVFNPSFDSELQCYIVFFWRTLLVSLNISQFSHSVMSDSLRSHGLQHVRLSCPSPTPATCSNSRPSSRWYQIPQPLSSPSPLAFNLSQHQGLFQWVSSSHQVAKVLEFQLQHQSFQWIFRIDLL